MDFIVEEEWEKKLQNENEIKINENENEKKEIKKSRRHSSIIMKHGLELFNEQEEEQQKQNESHENLFNNSNNENDDDDIFKTLSVKELKLILKNKIKQFDDIKSNEIIKIFSTICVKDELREFCKQYIDKSEIQELLNNDNNNNDNATNTTTNNNNNNTTATRTTTTTTTTTTTNKNLLVTNQLTSLSSQQIKLILKRRANEILTVDSETLINLISTAVEKSELIQLCLDYIPSNNDFERLCLHLNIELNQNSSSSYSPHSTSTSSHTTNLFEESINQSNENIESDNDNDNDDENNSVSSKSKKNADRKEMFRKMISLTALDDGTSLRGMLFKKGRGRSGFLRPWNERFFILNYTLLTLRYYNITGSTARSLNLDGSLPPEDTLKGEISINGCLAKALPFSATGKSHSFQVVVNDIEVIVLAANSEVDQQLWIERLTEVTQEREKALIEKRKKFSNVSTGSSVPRQRTSRHSRHSMQRGDSDEASTVSSTSFPPRKSVN